MSEQAGMQLGGARVLDAAHRVAQSTERLTRVAQLGARPRLSPEADRDDERTPGRGASAVGQPCLGLGHGRTSGLMMRWAGRRLLGEPKLVRETSPERAQRRRPSRRRGGPLPARQLIEGLDTLGGQPAGRARLALSSGPAAERVGERLTGAQRGRVRRQPLLEARRQWIEFKAEGEQRVPAADGQRITSVQHALAPDPRAERWRGRVRAGHVGVAVRGEKGLQLLVAQLPLKLEWVPHKGDGIELVDHVLREAALTAQRALARRPPD